MAEIGIPITIEDCRICGKPCTTAYTGIMPQPPGWEQGAHLLALSAAAAMAPTTGSCAAWRKSFERTRQQMLDAATPREALRTAARIVARRAAKIRAGNLFRDYLPQDDSSIRGLEGLTGTHIAVPIRCKEHRAWCLATQIGTTHNASIGWAFIHIAAGLWLQMVADVSRSCDEFLARMRILLEQNPFAGTKPVMAVLLNYTMPIIHRSDLATIHSAINPDTFAAFWQVVLAPWEQFVATRWAFPQHRR
jgi:hypothetical protein